MELEVIPAGPEHRPLLRQLLELYRYDFSELDHSDVDDQGFYGYRWLETYWSEPERHPFLFTVDGHPAGFALVRTGKVTEMAEFFVLRKYRGQGIGTKAARWVFALFPGKWLVSQVPGNAVATRFWRAGIPVPFDEQRLESGEVRQAFTVVSER
ncbi:GNAT family N-acetyltransferase [Sinomonas sp.]|jgi:predicted acetyltransferase|uniref:GNAT family N-acetyltransferase n=1 Tax=Sinomonas sp. TaxID=1914986 RepID=UPI002FDF5CCE